MSLLIFLLSIRVVILHKISLVAYV